MTAHPASPWRIGDIVVHRIDEVALPPETGAWLLPDATSGLVTEVPWLAPSFARPDGTLRAAVQTFALEIGGLRVLVDTGIGNGKTRANPAWHQLDTPYLDRLAAAGFPPESVDHVILTHLHADHVGWNPRLAPDGSWRPTFPRARYLTARAEYAYWSGVEMEESRRQMFRDSVEPVRENGQLDLIDVAGPGVEIIPGLTLVPAPGHTPGQSAVALHSDGQSALITGDCVHHPVQLAHPDLCSSVDIDPEEAVRTRRRLLDEVARTGALLLGSHFPAPTGGLVRRGGAGEGAYRLVADEG
ncbi:MBL fold metallo-hydrolase [Streptomyces sp. WAC 06783]|uniref:MBL fold metallo-hydrolase n=1 Tax=Streptomyces sp. WAC 06783 TaxID=2203211 RepID=UPI000F73EA03|nr:MBL fold metallo-hydrolase [Streptomyces sp. WAC 06783]RSO08162.1 MBL fold metallo-hydrolase [Streptomyces sp. WAC 06783]